MPHPSGGPAAGSALGLVLILVIVLGSISLAVWPIFPKVTATFQITKQYPYAVAFLSVKLDHLTFASASSIQKDAVFVYPVTPDQNSYTVNLVVQISYGGQTIVTSPTIPITTGVYSLSFVGNYRTEQPNVYYHIQLSASYAGTEIVAQADVPPT